MGFDGANELLRKSPREAREMALELLDTGVDPQRWLGFAIVGSSFRLEGHFAEAEAALYLAAANRPVGVLAEFELLGKLANVYRDQNDFDLAMRLLARKISLAQTEVDRAKALLERAVVQSDPAYPARNPGASYRQAALAREIFEQTGDKPYLEAALGLELLCASEDPGLANQGLDDLLSIYVAKASYPEDSLAASHVNWLVGLVLRRLGRPEDSRKSLIAAAHGFERQAMPVFWAVAMLDQAALELTHGYYRRTAEICGTIFPVLSAYRQDAQAWAAIRALMEATSRVAVTHVHLANARKALLGAKKLNHSDR